MYGNNWSRNYGIQDDGTWYRGLMNFSPEQLANGLAGCMDTYITWPPTLPQFRELCKPKKQSLHQPLAIDRAPRYSKEKAAEHLNNIFNTLKKKESTHAKNK